MIGSFGLDYLILVFIAVTGVFQMACAYNGLRGLLFFHNRAASFLLGFLLLAGAFAWFFLSEPRNVPDTTRGLNGTGQFLYFTAGTAVAFAVTVLVSSLRNWRMGLGSHPATPGLHALKYSNYPRTIRNTILLLGTWLGRWKHYRRSTAR